MTNIIAANTKSQSAKHPSLDEFIAHLQVLQAQGAGTFPVLVETRNRSGCVIYALANARKDTVERIPEGFRNLGTSKGEPVRVVRIG